MPIINHNLPAMNAARQQGVNNTEKTKSIEKLSSGLRINKAADDAAGLSISEKMRAQIKGLNQASRNSQDGISLIQTAEGSLSETHSILQRMRQLATQSSNGTNRDEDREKISKEFTQLQDEITRISNDSEFNKKKLLNGELSSETPVSGEDLGIYNTYTVGQTRSMRNGVTGSITTLKGSAIILEASVAKRQTSVIIKQASIQYIKSVYIVKSINTKLTSANSKITRVSAKIAVLSNDILNDNTLTGSAKVAKQNSIATLKGSISSYQTTSIAKLEGSIKTKQVSISKIQSQLAGKISNVKTKLTSVGKKVLSVSKKEASLTKLNHAVSLKEAGLEAKIPKLGEEVKFQVGANSGQVLELQVGDMRATALGVDKAKVNVNTQSAATNALTQIDKAISSVSDQRAKLGAVQNRLEHTISATDNTSENLQAAEARIRDVDMASEMMSYTKNNILSQASQAMLTQANSAPNSVLQLLQG